MDLEHEKFSGGVAVITGAGAGIGMGFARRFAQVGMTVAVTDVSLERAEAVAAGIVAAGGKAKALRVDVARAQELDDLAARIDDEFGPVRVLVNNAGIETMGYCWEIPAGRWDATLDINIHGVVHGCRAFIPRMLAHGGEAWIANLGSIGSFSQMPTQTAYIMTKHAVQSFSECLYLELEQVAAPIHVSTILPGMIRTSIFDPHAGTAGAGTGEPAMAERLRKTMRDLAGQQGMELDKGCAIFVRKMAENRFWIDSQPEMTGAALASRIDYLRNPGPPHLPEHVRALLQG